MNLTDLERRTSFLETIQDDTHPLNVYNIDNLINLFNTIVFTLVLKEFMFLEKRDVELVADNAVEVILSKGGFSLNTGSAECVFGAWMDYLGPPAQYSSFLEAEIHHSAGGSMNFRREFLIPFRNSTTHDDSHIFSLAHIGGADSSYIFDG